MSHACHRFWKCYKTLTFCSLLKRCNPLRLPRETTSEPPKVVQTPSVLYIFTSKCASHHNGVHFFDISTSKSGPTIGVLCRFWLRNALRATTPCTFPTSQLPKVLCEWCVLYILRSKCASRQNRVQFFISHLARWLRTRHFSDISTSKSGQNPEVFNTFDFEMCFAPQRRALF